MNKDSDRKPVIEFHKVGFQLPTGQALLRSINFNVFQGQTLVLLGRSGAGKTTALKLINRLLEPSSGNVLVNGLRTTAWDPIDLRRSIGYVIQETGLFPHYTVEQNVALVPNLERWPRARIRSRVEELLALVGLDPEVFLSRFPHELSGGQRKRVGVARALAADPPILLMDEPFGALDPITRSDVRREFHELQGRLDKTIVIVTHDIGEALLLGTQIGLVDSGELKGVYTPKEFLNTSEPVATAYLAQFQVLQEAQEGE